MPTKKIRDITTRALSIFGGAAGSRMDAAGIGRPVSAHAYPGGPPWSTERILAQLDAGSFCGCTVHVHGLMGDDLTWRKDDREDLGGHLQQHCGELPVYLRYKSGLDLHSNARRLGAWMRELEPALGANLPLSVVCHSMGGLIGLLAINRAHAPWTQHLRRLVLLGVPQHGAPLARASRIRALTTPRAAHGSIARGISSVAHGSSRVDLIRKELGAHGRWQLRAVLVVVVLEERVRVADHELAARRDARLEAAPRPSSPISLHENPAPLTPSP